MTLLTTVQYFCRRTGLPEPLDVAGSTDPQIKQVMALLEEEGQDLSMRADWEVLTLQAEHTTTAVEDQGAIEDIASNGFRSIKNDTIWDRTTILPVLGPMSPKNWQAMKALVTQGPRYRFRIRGGHLLVNPAPTAGDSWYFEYMSKNWILGSDGTTYKQYFTANDDTMLLPEDLLLLGLRWRYKKEKNLEYAEDFRTYEMQVKNALGNDGAKPVLYQDECGWQGPKPGIWVPDGSWSVN